MKAAVWVWPKKEKNSGNWILSGQTWSNIISEQSDRKLILYSLIPGYGHLFNTAKNLIPFIQYSVPDQAI